MATTSSGFQYPSSNAAVQVWTDIQALATTMQTWVDTYHATSFTTYTPTVTNGGTVTWTTQTGYWRYVGPKLVFVVISLIVNGAGSGASNVGVDLPTNPDRTLRQTLPSHWEGAIGAGALLMGQGVILTSGSGATIDRIRGQSNGATNNAPNLTGAGLLASANINIQGIYREA